MIFEGNETRTSSFEATGSFMSYSDWILLQLSLSASLPFSLLSIRLITLPSSTMLTEWRSS